MIVGLGIDLVDHGRVEKELARGDWCLADGIFLGAELRGCNDRKRAPQWYAACFAAKEAALKALGICVADLGVFRDVELKASRDGRYDIDFYGQLKARCDELGVKNATVCIAHGKKLTVASILLND